MSNSKSSTLYFLLFFLVSRVAFGQEHYALTAKDEALLDSLCETHLEKSRIPGIAVGIVSKGKVLYAKGFGVKHLEKEDPVSSQSNFHLASISKTFVATAIAQLVEKGKIHLDDPVTKYLSYFQLKDPKYKDITIKHLVTHTAGVPDVSNYGWRDPKHSDDALEKYVKGLKSRGLKFIPGSDFDYSNNGFEVLGDVIAKASGMSFESYIKTQIFEPLGMNNTSFIRSEIPERLATHPHIKRLSIQASKVYPYNREHAPSSTLNSNVDDMLNYALMYLNQGEHNGKRLFSEQTYELITRKHWAFSEEHGVGLSWFIGPASWRKGDGMRISHSGQDTGYQSWLGILPDKDWAMIVLYNGDWKIPTSSSIFDAAYDMAERYE